MSSRIEPVSFLTIYNAYNGQQIKITKPIRYHTLGHFKQFIYEQFYIRDSDVFLLTSFGIRLNFNIINEINEVYAFDKRMFNNENVVDQYSIMNNDKFESLKKEFLHLHSQGFGRGKDKRDIRTMSTELKLYKKYSEDIENNSIQINELMKLYLTQINNMFKSLNIVFQFINNFVNEIEKSFNSYFNYIKLIYYKTLLKTWMKYYQSLKKFPKISIGNKVFKLWEILDYQDLSLKAKVIDDKLPLVMKKFNNMSESITTVNNEKLGIDKMIEHQRNESINKFKNNSNNEILNQMHRHIEISNNSLDKLGYDSKLIETVYNDTKANHTLVVELSQSIMKNLEVAYNFKHQLTQFCLQIFTSISQVQMKSVEIKNNLKTLSLDDNSSVKNSTNAVNYETIDQIKQYEDYLSLTIDLPLIFGFLLIEKRRQFEWYDFYSRGIINNITEQLVTIIDHEKVFQKLWLKKFGSFIKFIDNSQLIPTPNLPHLDVTLINNQNQSIFNVLQDIEIQRGDILEYIKIIENYEAGKADMKFSNLLNANFKDLVRSTNNMKRVVKLVTSLSTFTSPNNSLSNSKTNKSKIEGEEEFDENLIKGLKTRIKKLEDLLHQQQFKNISNWPSFTRQVSETLPQSLVIPTKAINSPSEVEGPLTQSRTVITRSKSLGGTTDPIKLLSKSHTPLDEPIKHLDNVRLRKENNDLVETISQKDREINDKDAQLHQKDEQLQEKEEQLQEKDEQLNKKDKQVHEKDGEIKRLLQQVEMLKQELDEKTGDLRNQITNSGDIVREYKLLNESKDGRITELTKELTQTKEEIKMFNDVKQDLIDNMSSQEAEHAKQYKTLDDKVKVRDQKIEELAEDYDNLIDLSTKNTEIINDLKNASIGLFQSLKTSVTLNYDFFIEFCLVLESIGLLLVKEYNQDLKQDEYKITRVKGLRSKHDESIVSIGKPLSKVIEDVQRLMSWLNELDIESGINEEEKPKLILKAYNSIFNTSKFGAFIDIISFKDDKHQIDNFFLNGISKRFRDVEGFAKKLTKENKAKGQEMKKLESNCGNKLAMNNFQVGDLVLFLPTRIELDSLQENEELPRPWAAFNIGAPHYFLRNSTNLQEKEWIVGRVLDIKQFKVDAENINDKEHNPFNLSMGIVWYLVEAKYEEY